VIEDFRPDGEASRYFGVYPAIVTNIVDTRNLGRIEVKFPTLGTDGNTVRAWATLLTPYADDQQGYQMLPSVDTQVVVAFEAGDLRRPYIIGSAWNGKESLPSSPDSANNKRLIKTRSGSLLEFDDTKGAPKITISTSSGHTLLLDDGGTQVTLQHANGCVVTFNPAGQIQITANATVEVTASAVNVHAPAANFDGIVSCTTLNASVGVISPSYTPGAGNIW
jgi:uncharacterized protein involved in type VI secretion and phage assembly